MQAMEAEQVVDERITDDDTEVPVLFLLWQVWQLRISLMSLLS